MAWLADIPGMGAAQDRASRAMSFPVGAASPLWLAFGAAASAGVAWWLLGRFARPANLEAAPAGKLNLATPSVVTAMVAETVVDALDAGDAVSRAVTASAVEEATVVAEAVAETLSESLDAGEAVAQAVAETAIETAEAIAEPELPLAPPQPDDLTQIVGIGPKLAASLAERGVTTFAQLAAWTEADLAAADAALSLKGRAVRDAWIPQAKRFAAA